MSLTRLEGKPSTEELVKFLEELEPGTFVNLMREGFAWGDPELPFKDQVAYIHKVGEDTFGYHAVLRVPQGGTLSIEAAVALIDDLSFDYISYQ